jgi:hypothetical protein
VSSRRDRKAGTNPLLANTTDEVPTTTETKQEEQQSAQSSVPVPPTQPPVEEQPAPPPVVEQVVEAPIPVPPVQPIPQPVVQVQPTHVAPKLPPAPQARRVNRKVKFNDQFDKRTLSIDKRLLPYFDALMEDGPNKTVVANQWVLKMLLDAGYQIDPNILTQPYKKPR